MTAAAPGLVAVHRKGAAYVLDSYIVVTNSGSGWTTTSGDFIPNDDLYLYAIIDPEPFRPDETEIKTTYTISFDIEITEADNPKGPQTDIKDFAYELAAAGDALLSDSGKTGSLTLTQATRI